MNKFQEIKENLPSEHRKTDATADYNTCHAAVGTLTGPDEIADFVSGFADHLLGLKNYGPVDTSTEDKARTLVAENIRTVLDMVQPEQRSVWEQALSRQKTV